MGLERPSGPEAFVAREAAMEADGDIASANAPARYRDGHVRSVQCWRQKTIIPRRRPGERIKGGITF